MRRSIAWLRRDLRLTDNRVLAAATETAERSWAVFVVDPHLIQAHSAARGRLAWFAASVAALDTTLQFHGAGLTVLVGPPERELPRFARQIGADAVYAAKDEDHVAVGRDRLVADELDLRLIDDSRLLPAHGVTTTDGHPYSVFSPFARKLDTRLADEAATLTAAARTDLHRLAPRPPGCSGPEAFAADPAPHALPEAGEHAAIRRLQSFLRSDLRDYADGRNAPGLDGTSHLSPYLRVGAISVRAAWRAALNAADRARQRHDRALARGASAWRRELAWREFFAHVLSANPRLATESFRSDLDGMAWLSGATADDALRAWREGRTGYPLVDAGMRQLMATGWMHNRARLVTASFLVKHLGVDW
ncbi:MAG: deoxyribodipyrimidine photo-lyase, partial [Chloroflexota bacterium]|nr:deoxyribodipyrimidine photo-lyase [Chloroflexota bacterium]